MGWYFAGDFPVFQRDFCCGCGRNATAAWHITC
jgi:hypothetical protein